MSQQVSATSTPGTAKAGKMSQVRLVSCVWFPAEPMDIKLHSTLTPKAIVCLGAANIQARQPAGEHESNEASQQDTYQQHCIQLGMLRSIRLCLHLLPQCSKLPLHLLLLLQYCLQPCSCGLSCLCCLLHLLLSSCQALLHG